MKYLMLTVILVFSTLQAVASDRQFLHINELAKEDLRAYHMCVVDSFTFGGDPNLYVRVYCNGRLIGNYSTGIEAYNGYSDGAFFSKVGGILVNYGGLIPSGNIDSDEEILVFYRPLK